MMKWLPVFDTHQRRPTTAALYPVPVAGNPPLPCEEHTETVIPGLPISSMPSLPPCTPFSRYMNKRSPAIVNGYPKRSPASTSLLLGLLPLHRQDTHKQGVCCTVAGFDGILGNTMDAVSSRDFALEVLSCLSIMMTG